MDWLEELVKFCTRELNGLDQGTGNEANPLLQYRVANTFVTYASVTINLGMFA